MPFPFDIQAAGFSLTNAKACVEASRRAYVEQTIQSPLASVLIVQDDATGAACVAFRGSSNIRDCLTDARAVRRNHIHSGFSCSFESVAGSLTAALSILNPKALFITGHSKGAAEAVLAGAFFRHLNPQVYTFGQPRVGDAKFARMCNTRIGARHFRVVNQEDIVPRLPFWSLGYRHSGNEVFFPSIGPMCFGAPLWLKVISDAYGMWLDYKKAGVPGILTDPAIDHPVSRYVSLFP